MRKSSGSVTLTLLGSALALAGCGGGPNAANSCVGPDGKPLLGPDGRPLACNNGTRRGTTGVVILPGIGGGSRPTGGASTGVTSGGFGATGGHASGMSGGAAS